MAKAGLCQDLHVWSQLYLSPSLTRLPRRVAACLWVLAVMKANMEASTFLLQREKGGNGIGTGSSYWALTACQALCSAYLRGRCCVINISTFHIRKLKLRAVTWIPQVHSDGAWSWSWGSYDPEAIRLIPCYYPLLWGDKNSPIIAIKLKSPIIKHKEIKRLWPLSLGEMGKRTVQMQF